MRVLFLTPYFRPYLGGIERAIEQLSFQLLESPAVEAVGVLTAKYAFPRVPHPEWADRDATPEGIAIYRLSGFPWRSLPIYSVPLVWFSPSQIRRFVAEFNPDVIHFVGDGWFWGHFWSWFWYRKRARFIFTPSFHTLPVKRWWLRPLNGFICRAMDRVVAITRQETEQVRRYYWTPPQKQDIIAWGASLNPSAISQSATPPSESPLTILCVGRLGQHKGQEWLLRVYQQARTSFEQPTQLVMVGAEEDPGARDKLEGLARSAGLQGEVVLTGELEDLELAQWYNRADIFALFSQYEAFGLVYFEAMGYRTPALTHAVGSNQELLTRGAVVTPRFDQSAAVAELIRLVNDDTYRSQLAQEAQDYARSEFSWEAVSEKYLHLYRGEPIADH